MQAQTVTREPEEATHQCLQFELERLVLRGERVAQLVREPLVDDAHGAVHRVLHWKHTQKRTHEETVLRSRNIDKKLHPCQRAGHDLVCTLPVQKGQEDPSDICDAFTLVCSFRRFFCCKISNALKTPDWE